MGHRLIHEENIILNLSATDKESVLSQMSDVLYQNGFVKSTFKDAVIQREEEFATGLPTHLCSVAIPHTDVEHINNRTIGVAILEKEVPFVEMGTLDQQTDVKIVFMLAMDKVDDQLKLLQQLMQIFQSEEKLEQILRTNDRAALATIINEYLEYN
ncbi:PTS sugar transporter subunit IIA [Staphylococcus schweitzeri]|uniref:PTS sugar transporter subunit IIA n=1 Tax=Staphylococcus schweitzeri TaxID=1654388 RepID=A0A2K4AH25_9STAP|nr:PTS sugar transporter subunit IIA [Staphylococcus schweitzeri]MBE2127670.1 PTS sugar transporter subunit IIA [Staphylococcus schweitzeri]PNZ49385.1 PTS sugar transporter subunit IIA [Staphylococcus schweitzeri]CDR53222.1 putative PTS transport system IIA component [Staphylococcus schweitzeri]CDR66558.1 putative PTS transport system IIA component [Staphylococcus schweitzeri]VEE64819.1 EIIABC-Fru [Staphylococcus schweitzeri]